MSDSVKVIKVVRCSGFTQCWCHSVLVVVSCVDTFLISRSLALNTCVPVHERTVIIPIKYDGDGPSS